MTALCDSLDRHGKPCSQHPMQGSIYCEAHVPERRTRRREIMRAAQGKSATKKNTLRTVDQILTELERELKRVKSDSSLTVDERVKAITSLARIALQARGPLAEEADVAEIRAEIARLKGEV